MRRKSTRETFQRYLGDKGQAQQKMAHTVLGPEQDEGTSDELHRKGTLVAQGGVDVEKRGDRRKEGRGKSFFVWFFPSQKTPITLLQKPSKLLPSPPTPLLLLPSPTKSLELLSCPLPNPSSFSQVSNENSF